MIFLPLVLAAVSATDMAAKTMEFYIGTYTNPGGSQGIYHATLNGETGEISEPMLATKAGNPSFIALSKNGRFVYAVDENTDGHVAAYKVEPGAKLVLLNAQKVIGSGLCHAFIDGTGKNLFVAAYGSGDLASLPIQADGQLGAATFQFKHQGKGPDSDRQEGPHMHSAFADPHSQFVYACDLGTDDVLTFHLSPADGKLEPAEPATTKTAAGAGPRHLTFNAQGTVVYVNTEMGNTVDVFSRNLKTGALTAVQTISTLPAGESVKGKSTAEIELHPNGKWLYVSNRGDNTIAIYAVGHEGRLRLVEIVPAGVKIPRSFSIAPGGKWMVVAGQNSNDMVSLALDPATGRLSKPGHRVSVGHPVCIAFKH